MDHTQLRTPAGDPIPNRAYGFQASPLGDRRANDQIPDFFVQGAGGVRSEEHTSELQSLMRTSYAVVCLKKKTNNTPRQTSRAHIKFVKTYHHQQKQTQKHTTQN